LGGLISKLHDSDNNDREAPGTGISALILGSYVSRAGHEDGAVLAHLVRQPESGKPQVPGDSVASGDTGFSQFDRDPQVDLTHDLIEPGVARRLAEVASDRFQP
jgi:hypothetical protein